MKNASTSRPVSITIVGPTNGTFVAASDNGSSNGSSGGGAALNHQHESATDTIIEELKSLAKSMLDATNAARRRAHAQEGRKSYEALLTAIEGRSLPAVGDAVPISNAAHGSADAVTDVGSAASHAFSIHRNGHGSGNYGTNGDAVESSTHPGREGRPRTADLYAPRQPNRPQYNHNHHQDPTSSSFRGSAAAAVTTTTTGVADDLMDIPEDLNAQYIMQQRQTPETAAAGAGSRRGTAGGGAALAATPSLDATPNVEDRRQSKSRAEEDEDDDGNSNTFEGVMTQMFFKSIDPKAFNEVRLNTWKPEKLDRVVPSEALGQHPDGQAASEEDDEEEQDEDEERVESVVVRSRSGSKSHSSSDKSGKKTRAVRVLRVPAFPYGGGITEAQARQLQRSFHHSIRNAAALANGEPSFISKSQFDAREYEEVATTAAERVLFEPKSPYEFVVELERRVVFDAARTREERRREFKRLVKENRAPATMGTFNLRVIMDPLKTGFEEERNFPIVRGTIVAGRYQIVELLGKATFSRAVKCYDLQQPYYDDEEEEEVDCVDEEENDDDNDDAQDEEDGARRAGSVGDGNAGDADGGATSLAEEEVEASKKKKKRTSKTRKPAGYAAVCLKIINNTKDFFDQSLDEIRLLTLVNKYKDPDEAHVIRLIDAFYYKEHTMLVTELLSENLYEYSKYNREEEDQLYFTVPRIRRIARQIVEALAYVHSLNLMHADLKPENILFVSHRRCLIKVIDFGSSCYLSDHLSSYIQSRSYRAPEVILGCDYDGRIDVWSLGAILAELATGNVLFISETVPEMLARIVHVCGTPFPRGVLWEGRHTSSFFNKFGCLYERGGGKDGEEADDDPYYVYTPVPLRSSADAAAAAGSSPSVQTAERKESEGSHVSTDDHESPLESPYDVLREKMAEAGYTDPQFLSFLEACLTLDHKKRPTSKELLEHPFIVNEVI